MTWGEGFIVGVAVAIIAIAAVREWRDRKRGKKPKPDDRRYGGL